MLISVVVDPKIDFSACVVVTGIEGQPAVFLRNEVRHRVCEEKFDTI